MVKLVIVSCLVALAFGATVPDATNDNDFVQWSGRIVGGSTARAGQFRFIASLRGSAATAGHFCGGTLFSSRWIVSAAHCTINRTAGNTRAVIGALSRTTGGTSHTISRLVNHPSYNANNLNNDICLLQTSAAVVTTANIAPAVLSSTHIATGTAITAGWGQTSNPGFTAANLQWASVNVLTNEDCRNRHSAINRPRVFDTTICTYTRRGQGTCMGDSGGPLIQDNTLIGAVSWGIPCARGFPDVYVRISSYRDWIREVSGV